MDFLDHQAEESDGSTSAGSIDDIEPKQKKRKVEKKKKDNKEKKNKRKIESSDEEEDSDDEEGAEEMKGFIADEDEEEGDDKSEKSYQRDEEEEELDEDDMDLIEENLDIRKKTKQRIIQPMDSDDEDDDRTAIQKKLFGVGDLDDDGEGPSSRRIDDYDTHDRTRDGYSDSEQSEDNFIVNEDGGRPQRPAHRRRDMGISDHALDEARDVFGVEDFNFDEFYDEDEEPMEDEEEELLDEDEDGVPRARRPRPKEKKSTLLDTMEPSELERGFLAPVDKKVMLDDRPERFQLRRVAVTALPEGEETARELEEESKWIFMNAFKGYSFSEQESCELECLRRLANVIDYNERSRIEAELPAKIKTVLHFIRVQVFEVPFIAYYRKEALQLAPFNENEPEEMRKTLTLDDLWKIFEWDEKWCHLQNRKRKVCELMRRMQKFHIESEAGHRRPISEQDFYEVDGVLDEDSLNDVTAQFQLYYGADLNKMTEWERVQRDPDADGDEIASSGAKFKQSSRTDKYHMCVEYGVGEMAARFGLNARQVGENINWPRNEIKQDQTMPLDAAADYVSSTFPSAEAVIEGAVYMLAREISRDPLVRAEVRKKYRTRALISHRPTKQGREQMDDQHPLYKKRYVRNKPITYLKYDEYLYLMQLKAANNMEVTISCDVVAEEGVEAQETLLEDCLKEKPFTLDEYTDLVQEWNQLRERVLNMAITEMLIPCMEKEVHDRLLEEAKGHVLRKARESMRERVKWAAFEPPTDRDYDDDEDDESSGARVLAIAYAIERDEASFGALVDKDGHVVDYVRMVHMTKRFNPRAPVHEQRQREHDMHNFKKFLIRRRPHVIGIGAENMEARRIKLDLERMVADLLQDRELTVRPTVVMLDNEPAKVYMGSKMAGQEHAEYPPQLRQAVSLARLLLDPLQEYCHLWNHDDDILCLKFHPLQGEISKDILGAHLSRELINKVNLIGVDVNKCVEHAHTANMLQFVCGLGPRKATHLLKTLAQNENLLESRTRLVTLCHLGPKVFMNCAAFIKIDTHKVSERTDSYVEVLDGSRVHPETYEWARKMAIDALEVDDSADPTAALEEILQSPDRLKDLDLDAFAEELDKQGFGSKATTLYDIRDELNHRYKDTRVPYQPPNDEQLFRMLTGETPESMENKLVQGTVLHIVHKRLTDEQKQETNSNNPAQRGEDNTWKCPWCGEEGFVSISDVFDHIDGGDRFRACPGQAVGVKVRLDNGMQGFIPRKLISSRPDSFKNPAERVKPNQVIYCRITRVDVERLSCDLTCRSVDLQAQPTQSNNDEEKYWDASAEMNDLHIDKEAKEKKKVVTNFVKRVISHPSFKNVTYRDAERQLAKMEQGDCIIRPSSKSAKHLTVTWKVADGVYQHIDVEEKDKEQPFTLGKRLIINNDEFEDLDEIIARFVQPMASFAREVLMHKYFFEGVKSENREAIEGKLADDKRQAPSRIPYTLTPSVEFPAKFVLSYQVRAKARHEYMTVTCEGVRFRGQMFNSLEALLTWFKVNFSKPVPQAAYGHAAYRR